MKKKLFWKLCLIIATGVVLFFYLINTLVSITEEGMSFISQQHKRELHEWAEIAEKLYIERESFILDQWINKLKIKEGAWIAVAQAHIKSISGEDFSKYINSEYMMGRSLDWKVHLYFKDNPVMEIPFSNHEASLLVQLPDRMRPGAYLAYMTITLQIILPFALLTFLSWVLYRHIVIPLKRLDSATRSFSEGDFSIRVRPQLGQRNDEIGQLAATFDHMAEKIGVLFVRQKQLIADISHELRTPLTRLDMSLDKLIGQYDDQLLIRIRKESQLIRSLVEDTLTLAWLDNEEPELRQESLDLVDLLDVIIADARFEYPYRQIDSHLPEKALILNSDHKALGQAFENLIRNALHHTSDKKSIKITCKDNRDNSYKVSVIDQGCGVPDSQLTNIFLPFFKLNQSRHPTSESYGLGLALAKRQVNSVGGQIRAENNTQRGLSIIVLLPKH